MFPLKAQSTSRSLLFLLLFFAGIKTAHAQQSDYLVAHQFLSVEDGLASREVFCGLQDSRGFIWFGTRNGLNRYDGKNFLLFTHENEGLQSNKILQIAEDDGGYVWINYGKTSVFFDPIGEIDLIDIATHQVKSFSVFFNKAPFKENEIKFIYGDKGKRLIIGTTTNEVWLYSHSQGFKKWFTFSLSKGAYEFHPCISNGKTLIVEDNQGKITCASPDSVYNLAHPVVHFHASNQQDFYYSLTAIMFNDAGECVYLHRPPGLNSSFAVVREGQVIDYTLVPEAINHKTKDLLYWYEPASGSALFKIDTAMFLYQQGQLQTVLGHEVLGQFPGMQIRGFFTDRTGKIWIYSSVGVFIVKIVPNKFTHYFTNAQLPLDNSNQARGIYADPAGNLYAQEWNSLCLLEKGDIKHPKALELDGLAYAIVPYSDSLIFSLGYNIWRYNTFTLQAVKLSGHDEIWSGYKLSSGKLLLGSVNGLEIYDTETGSTKNNCADSFPHDIHLYRIFRSHDNKLWVVAENGLYIVNEEACIIDYYGNASPNSRHNLPFGGLNDAYEDEQGIFWLATNGQGLLRWNRKTDSIKQFSLDAGFSSTIMYRIESDNHKNLWISTDYGLARFNTQNFSVHTFTLKDGITHNEFNRNSSYKAGNGRLYFGGLDGVNGFNPDDFLTDTGKLSAPLRLLSFAQFDVRADKLLDKTTTLTKQGKITLRPGERFFNLEFGLLDYEHEPHSYSYIIEGLDKTWNYISENSIRISGLPYGQFTLRVRGQNINGQQSAEELAIPIIVIKPFYLSTWFFVLLILIIIVFIYLFVYLRTWQLERDNIKLESTVANRTYELSQSLHEKDSLLKEVHHRVKNNLQTISSLLDLQSRNISDESAKYAIREGQNRVRSIALIHQNLYQNENLGAIEFGTFINELAVSIQDVFKKPGFDFELINNIPKTYLDVDTAVPMGLIANELFTNSFKYGYGLGNLLQVTVTLKDLGNGTFLFDVRDNGPGLPPAFKPESAKTLGMRLISRLSEQLDGKVIYTYNKGSVFEIYFKNTEARKKED